MATSFPWSKSLRLLSVGSAKIQSLYTQTSHSWPAANLLPTHCSPAGWLPFSSLRLEQRENRERERADDLAVGFSPLPKTIISVRAVNLSLKRLELARHEKAHEYSDKNLFISICTRFLRTRAAFKVLSRFDISTSEGRLVWQRDQTVSYQLHSLSRFAKTTAMFGGSEHFTKPIATS